MTDLAELAPLAAAVLDACKERNLKVVTAESCTGGLVAAALSEIPGASAVLERGFVTYSNAAKTELLAVPAALIDAKGAVSPEVADAMAEGALASSHADIAVSITGIAGPEGGSAAKPVGLVHFATAVRGGDVRHVERRFGNPGRGAIRMAAAREALSLLRALAQSA